MRLFVRAVEVRLFVRNKEDDDKGPGGAFVRAK